MDAPWLQLIIVAVLVMVNGLFSGTEIALISLREGQLARLEAESESGRLVGRLARDPNEFFATIQIGITLAGFLASAVAAIAIAEPLVEPLGFLGGAAEPIAIVAVTAVLTFITLVAGELAPKRVAMQRAERWALMAARPLLGIGKLMRPIVILLSWSTNLLVRVLGADPEQQREDVTEEELRELVATQTVLRPDQRSIISGAFEISDRPLREIYVPRRDVATLDAHMSAADGLNALAAQGHSRAPVIEADDLDSVIGIAHMRDLIGDGSVRDAARPAPVIPETVRVLDALNLLRAEREQMAIVIDEHGGAEGIVTVEDLLEEIVGEIYDETDVNVISARRLPDGSYLLPGTFPMHDLIDLGIDLPSGDYATVAGLMLDRLGRIPERVGEFVVVDGWLVTVRALQGRAIERVALRHVAD